MTATLVTALFVQLIALVLLRSAIGPAWMRRPVSILVIASVISQGLCPALLVFPSVAQWDYFRLGVPSSDTDQAALVMSVFMLTFVIGYALTRPGRAVPRARFRHIVKVTRALDWRLLAGVCVPLAALTVAGEGYNSTAGTGTTISITSTLFIAVITLTSAAFLLRHGTRWLLPVLVAQSGVLALAGERTPVLMAALALIVVMLRAGYWLPPGQIAAAAVLTIVAMLAITGVRADQGRDVFYADNGVAARLSAIATGISHAGESQTGLGGGSPADQAVVRTTDTDFAGAIIQSEDLGQPRLSPSYVLTSLLLAVPSAAFPSKLSRGDALNPADLQTSDFGLQDQNFIPGFFGLYYGMLPPAAAAAGFALVGWVFGQFERWVLARCTPVRFVLLAEAVIAALWYQAGLPVMLVEMRAALVLAVVVKAVQVVRSRRRRRRGPARGRHRFRHRAKIQYSRESLINVNPR